MDFKKKLKSIINDIRDSTVKSPDEDVGPPLIDSPAVAKYKHLNQCPSDPLVENEAFDSIEPVYYSSEQFDASEYELKKLPEQLQTAHIDKSRETLNGQLHAVSKKVSKLVLENQRAYVTELHRVMELQKTLHAAGVICANGRKQLGMAKQGFTTASLGLLANYKKRQQLTAILKSLRTIKTLQQTDIRLKELLEEEDYPAAIQLCLECQKADSTFKHYHCFRELGLKLQDTLETIEANLDAALSKTCNNFDRKHYEKVQAAYRLLGKTQTAMDQPHMRFTSALHNAAFNIVLGYVELCSGNGEISFHKRQYSDLCKHISVDMFTACLIDLCKALWEVMKSYYQTKQWHESYDRELSADNAASGTESESAVERQYILQKLETGLDRIWTDVQQIVKVYLLSTDIGHFKYDEFIQVLGIVNRLMQIGEAFCGSKSESLQDSIRRQSVNYFRNYHRSRMDELRMFLENESWQLCPVKASFSILHLLEFRFMRQKNAADTSVVSEETVAPPSDSRDSDMERWVSGDATPFSMLYPQDEESEDVLDISSASDDGRARRSSSVDSDDEIADELKQDYIDEHTGDDDPLPRRRSFHRQRSDRVMENAPIVTNTTLTVCRLFGRYMQMINVLKPIAYDVINSMSQLFDYYLYAVNSFFAADLEMNDMSEHCLSDKLRTTLNRIQKNLIAGDQEMIGDRVAQPHLSPMVDLVSKQRLYGLAERLVATESLVFLAEQIDFLLPQLEDLIPQSKKTFLQQFHSQTVATAAELRGPVYRTVAACIIDDERLLDDMALVRWDIHEIMSQHSSYVDDVVKEFESFDARLQEMRKRVPITKVVSDVLWEHCIRLVNDTFVEGYSNAKKCTNGGRALMQLDFQQLLTKLEKLTHLRPIPGRDYVEAYVKAYYLPDQQLDNWIREHKEYTSRQMLGLINCMPHISKKARQRLQGMIEESDRTRR